jgi:hypothetical protein
MVAALPSGDGAEIIAPTRRRTFAERPGHRAVTNGELRGTTAGKPRSCPRLDRNDAFGLGMKSAGLAIVTIRPIGDDGARPEVGWVPPEMDERRVP